ncbi:DUF2478 domain-containing protein [Antarcticimicrobium sediminis]|uniref:DUF2478 domain-containing protein n=1 Tax=Antarcticimicrobium sediminis TaxID=2546227 RepID=A0A4R5F0U2_9RHOB|nr:DUF2478 domain-containing protein [Antarcticimicrobium sediminis]TDE41108.1 DUF2478 domain-containing protein [Antarcticimicrobium sediminis]
MKIAYVSATGRGETDRLLSQAAAFLGQQQVATAGIVKELSYDSAFENGCDMKVRVLPDGPVIKITQDLGQGSAACRLDPAAIAEAVAQVETSGLADARMFILNKFGPEEIAGRGFRSAIAAALELGIPVLVGVGSASRADFDAFAEGLAAPLPADPDAIAAWCLAAVQA